MKIRSFKEMAIWKISINIVKNIYNVTIQDKFSRDYCLRDQIRRASISISSNIAEGFERSNNNEFIYFLKIAKGSVGEVRTQLIIAMEVGYIRREEFYNLEVQLIELANQIGKFISYLRKLRKNNDFQLNK